MTWLKDPTTGLPSVPLTLLVLACAIMLVFICVECATTLKSTHLLDEFFGACMALYGGHMVTSPRSPQAPTPSVSPPADTGVRIDLR